MLHSSCITLGLSSRWLCAGRGIAGGRQYDKSGQPTLGNMLRIITIPSLLWLCIGCSVGAGYYDPFPSSSVARDIEQDTGSNLSGSGGAELGLLVAVPFNFGEKGFKDPSGFWGVVELKNRFISDDVRLDGVTAALAYSLPLSVDSTGGEGLFLTGGLGVGRHHLDIDGLAGDTATGVHASIGLDYPYPTMGFFIEARYQMLDFDTAYGELDASGFEIVIGVRIDAVIGAQLLPWLLPGAQI